MKEEVKGLVEARRHAFQNKVRDPIRARCLVVRDTSEGFLIARKMRPAIMGMELGGVGAIWVIQGNRAPIGKAGSRKSVFVSKLSTCAMTSPGFVRLVSVSLSRITKRFVSREWEVFPLVDVRWIECKAIFDSFKSIRRRALSQLSLRWLRRV